MGRYTVLRILVFFGCLAALWLAGLRDEGTEQLLLVVGAAVLSMVISFFVLKPFREDASRAVAAKVEGRMKARAARREAGGDEQVEDDEGDGATYR